MVRKLKYHEQKLLKKVDFITYKQDNNHRVAEVSRRYMIQKPEDYHKYNRICGVRSIYLLSPHKKPES
jgi:U3 small nucleolar ribonucleoprotein protein IMP3